MKGFVDLCYYFVLILDFPFIIILRILWRIWGLQGTQIGWWKRLLVSKRILVCLDGGEFEGLADCSCSSTVWSRKSLVFPISFS